MCGEKHHGAYLAAEDGARLMSDHNTINSPRHYTSLGAKCSSCGHPIECIDVTERFSFTIGNAIKYLWRAGLKGDAGEDLKKAAWYVAREIARRERNE